MNFRRARTRPVAAIVYANEVYPDAVFKRSSADAARWDCRLPVSCSSRPSRVATGAVT